MITKKLQKKISMVFVMTNQLETQEIDEQMIQKPCVGTTLRKRYLPRKKTESLRLLRSLVKSFKN